MDPQDIENIQVPPSEIEPTTASTASMAEAAPGVSPAQQPDSALGAKNRRWPWILAITTSSVALVVVASLAAFYFLYRTPDQAYVSFLKELRTLRESAETIPFATVAFDDTFDVSTMAPRQDAAEAYVAALAELKKSPILTADNEVRRAYDNDKAKIEAYGQSTLDMIETATVYLQVDTTCREEFGDLSGVETVDMLHESIAACEDLLAKYPSVPLESFDEAHYGRYVDSLKAFISAAESVYEAYEDNDAMALVLAEEKINRAGAAYTLATSGSPKMNNTANPKDAIDSVIASAEKRKPIFFRH